MLLDKKKKLRLKYKPRLVLIGLQTTGLRGNSDMKETGMLMGKLHN